MPVCVIGYCARVHGGTPWRPRSRPRNSGIASSAKARIQSCSSDRARSLRWIRHVTHWAADCCVKAICRCCGRLLRAAVRLPMPSSAAGCRSRPRVTAVAAVAAAAVQLLEKFDSQHGRSSGKTILGARAVAAVAGLAGAAHALCRLSFSLRSGCCTLLPSPWIEATSEPQIGSADAHHPRACLFLPIVQTRAAALGGVFPGGGRELLGFASFGLLPLQAADGTRLVQVICCAAP